MAAAFTGNTTPEIETELSGRRVWYYYINGTDVEAASEVEIQLPTHLFTVVYFEAAFITAGDATTLRPALGVAAGFADDSIDFVSRTETAAAKINNQTKLNIASPTGSLWVRPAPDDTATRLQFKIAIMDGIAGST